MIPPPVWTSDELERERLASIAAFRDERLLEPVTEYLRAFDEYRGVFASVLDSTRELSEFTSSVVARIADDQALEAIRYLVGPPISADDLKTLADVASLNPSRLQADPLLCQRVIDVLRASLDRRRFPWVLEGRPPSPAERGAAILASASLLATRRVETARRSHGKAAQESRVRAALEAHQLRPVAPRAIRTLADAPGLGEFCGEAQLGERKADFAVRLRDNRVMPIECKVSNSSTNSIKRLNNDAAAKAEAWRKDFGATQVVPVAVLSGVYKLANLEQAQRRGLTLFWAHALDKMTAWMAATK